MDAQYAAACRICRHHWWWRVREQILIDKIGRLMAGAGDVRILDVGCGAGLFFDALARFGHVEGIESDAASAGRNEAWRSRIAIGELDASYTPTAPFDLILMLDVLEHVPDAGALVERAASILKPHGRILITVPAFEWLWTAHDDMNHHLKRYTAGGLRQMIRDAGLVAIDTHYMFQSLVIPKLIVRAKERLTAGRPTVPKIPSSTVNSALQA
jgi:2-polyprenyl-3-methyl-5-hydroxy-6-metoxy-1,4-benzoquinol methylase